MEIELLHYAATLIQKVFRGFMVRQYIRNLKKQLYYGSHNEYGFCIKTNSHNNSKTNSRSQSNNQSKHNQWNKTEQKQRNSAANSAYNRSSKQLVNKMIITIQSYFRGYLSRKYLSDYRKLKAIVLFLEGHIHYFLRKRIQQRKTSIKALQAQCYTFQSQCKQIANNRTKISRFMNQKQFDEVNGILFTSFLTLMIPNFDKLSAPNKTYYVEQLLNVCSSQPTPAKKNCKTPLKQRQVIQNISVLSSDVIPSNGTSTSTVKSRSNISNEEFKNLLFQQKKPR